MEELVPTPANLKGCTSKPLFDAVPICHYIVPVLHLVIGIGNGLMDSMFEWIEEHHVGRAQNKLLLISLYLQK